MFTKIIANPPYGKSSSLSKKIVNKMLENKVAEEIVYLSPTNTYKSGVLKNVQKVQRVEWGTFEDASIYDLCATVLSEKTGPFVDYASFVLNEKLLKLHRFTQDYNKTHSSNFKVETRGILDCKKDWSKTFAFSFAINNGGTTDATSWEDSIDLTCFSNKRSGPTGDIKFNFGKDFESFYKRLNGDVSCLRLIDMHSEKERANFSHWYYKASPLVNAIRSTISQCENITPRAQCYIDYLPHLDWSHPWTDQEILKEIGLPEDFLEDKYVI